METDDLSFDLHREYLRTLQATRVAATVAVLLSGAWCALKFLALGPGREVMENMVRGGLAALPTVPRLIFNYGTPIFLIALVGGIGALVMIWTSGRSLSRVIYVATAAVAGYLLVAAAFESAVWAPMTEIITRFQG